MKRGVVGSERCIGDRHICSVCAPQTGCEGGYVGPAGYRKTCIFTMFALPREALQEGMSDQPAIGKPAYLQCLRSPERVCRRVCRTSRLSENLHIYNGCAPQSGSAVGYVVPAAYRRTCICTVFAVPIERLQEGMSLLLYTPDAAADMP